MPTRVDLVVDARCTIGESPVWIVGEQALYWVDIREHRIWRWQAASGAVASWPTHEAVGCIAPASPGRFVAGMESGVFLLTPSENGTVAHAKVAEVSHAAPAMRFNDGRCDRQGRFWSGTMVNDVSLGLRAGVLYRLVGTGPVARMLDGMITPNGLAFSPDGRTMYLSDSHPSVQTIWRFDYDVETATPSARRLFVDMNPLAGRPDGAAVDCDGCYWSCANDAGLVHRFTPDGRLDRSLALPVAKPAMCAFGGADLCTLFVTSIRPANTDLATQPLAGGVFALRPGVRGIEETRFGAS